MDSCLIQIKQRHSALPVDSEITHLMIDRLTSVYTPVRCLRWSIVNVLAKINVEPLVSRDFVLHILKMRVNLKVKLERIS